MPIHVPLTDDEPLTLHVGRRSTNGSASRRRRSRSLQGEPSRIAWGAEFSQVVRKQADLLPAVVMKPVASPTLLLDCSPLCCPGIARLAS